MSWDQEAREAAQREARLCQRRDKEAAALLLAQLDLQRQAAVSSSTGDATTAAATQDAWVSYDPVDLYCRLARELHWRDQDMDEMDYARFFAYVDRLARQQQREREENEQPRANTAMEELQAQSLVAGAAPAPRTYQGPVVPYRG